MVDNLYANKYVPCPFCGAEEPGVPSERAEDYTTLRAEVERLIKGIDFERLAYRGACGERDMLKDRLPLSSAVVDAVRDDGGRYGAGTSWCLVDTLRQAVSQTDDVYNLRLLCAADRLETALAALSPKEGK